jgi:hypothetical protein
VIRPAVSPRQNVIDNQPMRTTRTVDPNRQPTIEINWFIVWACAALLTLKPVADKNETSQRCKSRISGAELFSRSWNATDLAVMVDPVIGRRLGILGVRLRSGDYWADPRPKMLRAQDRLHY